MDTQEKQILFTTSTGKEYPVYRNGRVYFARYPIEWDDGKYLNVQIKKGGYDDPNPVPIPLDYETAIKSAKAHNEFIGLNAKEVDEIIAWSMRTGNK